MKKIGLLEDSHEMMKLREKRISREYSFGLNKIKRIGDLQVGSTSKSERDEINGWHVGQSFWREKEN